MFDLIPWRRRDVETAPDRSAVDLWREMDSVFDRFFGDMGWREPSLTRQFVPALDVSENGNEFVVKAELPGMDPKEVDINLTGNLLTIRGEKKHEKEEKGDGFHRMERSYGSFSRSFQLPCEVQEDKIEAHHKNGVLDLRLPKAESAKRKSVKIAVEAP